MYFIIPRNILILQSYIWDTRKRDEIIWSMDEITWNLFEIIDISQWKSEKNLKSFIGSVDYKFIHQEGAGQNGVHNDEFEERVIDLFTE